MKKLVLILFCLPLLVNAQNSKHTGSQIKIKDLFKFGTIYGAVNGNTSISDLDVYSVTDGLETVTIETPFDYSVLFGNRKI